VITFNILEALEPVAKNPIVTVLTARLPLKARIAGLDSFGRLSHSLCRALVAEGISSDRCLH
jgi:hypothetical protein